MWQHYFRPTTLEETLELLQQHAGAARIVAGGTDVMVELSRGVKPTSTLIDITALRELAYIRHENGVMRLGALATHNDVIASAECVQSALPLAQACLELGAPPIRTRATVAGNVITASPANDTISALLALDAALVLSSVSGERVVALRDFYPGFRRTALRPDELVREIRFRALNETQRGLYLKLGLRRAQAISVIHLAFVVEFESDEQEDKKTRRQEEGVGSKHFRYVAVPCASAQAANDSAQRTITEARIALGCLAPTVVRAPAAEAFLQGKTLSPEVCAEAARLCAEAVAPIGDVRGSAAYRVATLHNLAAEGLRRIAAGREREGWPQRAVLLEAANRGQGSGGGRQESRRREQSAILNIETTINGQSSTLSGAQTKTLLDALREDAGLTGTKSGCNEGECGACTVWLDGKAVMACLTPAAQAQGREVTTIEGLAETVDGGRRTVQAEGVPSTVHRPPSTQTLHPLQAAFIRNGAVQCGYCIPGMLMAGAKLLQECPGPNREQARTALSGNICRCTGYRKILDAVVETGKSEVRSQESE